jgi:hypothetical protein
MYPLQERAAQLREAFKKQAQAEKANQKQQAIHHAEELTARFSKDFPELYNLLIASAVALEGNTNLNGQKILLSYQDKQVSVMYEETQSDLNKWCFRGKEYTALVKESEQRLIVALADAFSQGQSKTNAAIIS